MRLAEHSVPMINPEEGNGYGGGLSFCPINNSVKEFASRTAGKLLVVSDGTSYYALAWAASLPRTISVVLDGEDALPLFTMPDGVGGVFAAGNANTLRTARLFAQVRRIPCTVAPTQSSMDGVFEERGMVCAGERLEFPLATAEVVCDLALLKPTLAEGYARLLLGRLALFEARALALFVGGNAPDGERFRLLQCSDHELSAEEIVRTNAFLRRHEGAYTGEGIVLAEHCGGEHAAFRAFWALSALYAAFFKRGRPRKYVVPDYAKRAERAGVPLLAAEPPTAEEFARRAFIFERRRGDLLRELELILRGRSANLRRYNSYAQTPCTANGRRDMLYTLPELAPNGLSAIIRDFGLMEGI